MLRPYADIMRDLRKPLPKQFVKERVADGTGNRKVKYVPWYVVAEMLDTYAPGWQGEPTDMQVLSGRMVVTYSLTIHAEEGAFTRVNTGTESDWDEDEEVLDKRSGEMKKAQHYGDPTSNAQRMAFKRAAADFGVCRDLYDKDNMLQALRKHLAGEPVSAPPVGKTPQGPPEDPAQWHKLYIEILDICNTKAFVAGRVVRMLQRTYGQGNPTWGIRELTIAQLKEVKQLLDNDLTEGQLRWLRSPLDGSGTKPEESTEGTILVPVTGDDEEEE